MGGIDYERAEAFIAAIPTGRWSAYKDVAAAAGNPRAAQAIGTWLAKNGVDIPLDYRVLNADGRVSLGFKAAGIGAPPDARSVRERLANEGVQIDATGHASQAHRFFAADWGA